MSPEFATAIDPVFLQVIAAMESLSRQDHVDASALHSQITVRLRQAEDLLQHGENRDVWQLARYALCAWIDDVMITMNWEGQRWWENHKLEFQFFNTNDAGSLFYQKAKDATQLMRRDAIEVFYIAVILGFRGLYALPESTFIAQQYDLPPTIEEWTRRTAGLLQTRRSRQGLTGVAMPVDGAPPLESRFTVVGAAMLTLMLLVIAVVVGYHILAPENQTKVSRMEISANACLFNLD